MTSVLLYKPTLVVPQIMLICCVPPNTQSLILMCETEEEECNPCI